ncbi:hypothetical protein D3C76_903730 [compost metagenome]
MTAAISGLLKRVMVCHEAWRGSSRMPTRLRSAISLMSAPAAKALRLPVRTTARVSGSACAMLSSAASSPSNSVVRAFRACGRCRVIRRTPGSINSTARVRGMADALTVHARRGAGSLLDRPRGPVLPKYSYNVIRKCNTKIDLMCLIGECFDFQASCRRGADGGFFLENIGFGGDFRDALAFVGKVHFK